MGQAEQDPDLPHSASNVFGKVQSHLCLTEWRGEWKCRQGKSTLGAACPTQHIMFCNLCCTLGCIRCRWHLSRGPPDINGLIVCYWTMPSLPLLWYHFITLDGSCCRMLPHILITMATTAFTWIPAASTVTLGTSTCQYVQHSSQETQGHLSPHSCRMYLLMMFLYPIASLVAMENKEHTCRKSRCPPATKFSFISNLLHDKLHKQEMI